MRLLDDPTRNPWDEPQAGVNPITDGGASTLAAPMNSGLDAPLAQPWAPPTKAADTTPSIPNAPAPSAPSQPSQPAAPSYPGATGVGAITQLPDGAGGSVMVPPAPLAPPTAQPWSAAPVSPVTMSAGDAAPALTLAEQRAQNTAAGFTGPAVTAESGEAIARADGIPFGVLRNPDGSVELAPWVSQGTAEQQAAAQSAVHGPDSRPWSLAGSTDPWTIYDKVGGPNLNQYGVPNWTPPPAASRSASVTPMAPGGPTDTQPWSSSTTPPVTAAPGAVGQPGYGAAPAGVPAGPAAPGTFNASDNAINSVVSPGNDPRLAKLQGLQDTALTTSLQSPDRLAMARNYLESDALGLDQQYQHDKTDATDEAAAHGQIGSGQLTNRYGDLFSGLTNSKRALGLRYLTDAAGATVADRRNNVADTSSAAGQAYSQGVGNRTEARTERSYQQDLAQQALLNRIRQYQLETGADTTAFDQAMRLYQAGQGPDPTAAYETAAGQATSEAGGNMDSVAALLASLGRRR